MFWIRLAMFVLRYWIASCWEVYPVGRGKDMIVLVLDRDDVAIMKFFK